MTINQRHSAINKLHYIDILLQRLKNDLCVIPHTENITGRLSDVQDTLNKVQGVIVRIPAKD